MGFYGSFSVVFKNEPERVTYMRKLQEFFQTLIFVEVLLVDVVGIFVHRNFCSMYIEIDRIVYISQKCLQSLSHNSIAGTGYREWFFLFIFDRRLFDTFTYNVPYVCVVSKTCFPWFVKQIEI